MPKLSVQRMQVKKLPEREVFFALLFVLYKKQGEKARGACRPGRDKLSKRKVESFFALLFVLYKK